MASPSSFGSAQIIVGSSLPTNKTPFITLWELAMIFRTLAASLAMLVLAGCASVPMETKENSDAAKQFAKPADGYAGIYVYRYGSFGAALKKDIWIDGKCIGESARNVFFHEEVKGDTEHKISTESEFSPNDLMLTAVAGLNYFVRQYIKFGVFVGGAGLELVSEEQGQQDVRELELAKKGTCSK